MKEKMEKVSKRVKDMREKNKEKREELRVKVKAKLHDNEKLKERLDQISNDKLEKLLPVIDRLILKVENNTRLSDDTVNARVATYNALKDVINEKLESTTTELENTVESLVK